MSGKIPQPLIFSSPAPVNSTQSAKIGNSSDFFRRFTAIDKTITAMKTYEVKLTTGLTGYISADGYAEKEGWLRFHCSDGRLQVATYPSASVDYVAEFAPAFADAGFFEGNKFDDL
jgi:hypothetical protein